MSSAPSSTELVDALLTVTHGMKRAFDARLQELDLSLARAKVLLALHHEGPTRIGTLGHQMDVAARTMTSTVEALERDGLVTSAHDPDDARARVIAITRAGEELVADVLAVRHRLSEDVFASLGPDERSGLLDVLCRIGSAVDAQDPSCRSCAPVVGTVPAP